jgi:hypothetical protein
VVLGHVVEFVEEWQVVVGDDVAGDAGVPVPVPGAADIRAALDDANAFDAVFAQPRRGQQRRESTADKQAFDGIVERLARLDFAGVGVDLVAGQIALEVGGVLRGAVRGGSFSLRSRSSANLRLTLS